MQRFRVVIADDLCVDLEIERSFFLTRGFEMLTARDGHVAMSLAVSELPALMILGEVMPGLSGTEVCALLKSHQKTQDIPVVIVGADETEDVKRACRQARADAFMPKSAGRERLMQVVGDVLQIPIRKAARMTVFFSVKTDDTKKETLGHAVDLSEGGLRMEVNRGYEPGSSLNLRFLPPGEKKEIQAQARVRWVDRQSVREVYLVGLEFAHFPIPMDRMRLSRYMNSAIG